MSSFQNQKRLPVSVRSAIRDLLENRAIEIKHPEISVKNSGIDFFGLAEKAPEIGIINDQEVYIWHAPSGLLPLSQQELERWSVDAPRGSHWILSEREVPSKQVNFEGLEVVIWNPDEVSMWIGRAIVSGELIANNPPSEGNLLDEQAQEESDKIDDSISLSPLIEAQAWLSQRGLEGASSTPVLLYAKLWKVSGDLLGPDGSSESGVWHLLEDPWSNSLQLMDISDSIENFSDLRIFKPREDAWLSGKNLNEKIESLLEVRKKSQSSQKKDQSQLVRSMLLQTWSFQIETANIGHQVLFIPAWIIQNPDEKLLHGRNGRTYEIP